jgi:alpha-galactosidase
MPVSMTCGPCGISAALRTVPVAAEIVEEMEELCPGAWVLNETNPMTAATDAMNRVAEKTHVLGLCHGVHVLPAILERALGLAKPEGMSVLEYMYHWLEEQGFDYAFGGLNHFVFIVRANYRGEDVLPRIRAWAHENRDVSDQPVAEEGQATSFFYNGIQANRIVCDQTGYMPINHDRHTVEFWPGLCNQQTGFGMRWTRKTFVDARRLMKIEQLARIRRIAAGEEELDWSHTGEELTMIMHGILTDTPTRTVVNVPNTGQIPNMPEGTVVESLGKVYADRVEPEFVGDLPGVVGSWNRLHADVVRLTVEAALEGSRDKFIQALSLDPVAGLADFSDLPAMADELLEANRPWLPRFFD